MAVTPCRGSSSRLPVGLTGVVVVTVAVLISKFGIACAGSKVSRNKIKPPSLLPSLANLSFHRHLDVLLPSIDSAVLAADPAFGDAKLVANMEDPAICTTMWQISLPSWPPPAPVLMMRAGLHVLKPRFAVVSRHHRARHLPFGAAITIYPPRQRSAPSLRYQEKLGAACNFGVDSLPGCCPLSPVRLVLAWVEHSFTPMLQTSVRHRHEGACLSPVKPTTYPRLNDQPPLPRCKREAYGNLCRHCPVIMFAAFPMGHCEDFPTPWWHANSEILLKPLCLAFALQVQSCGIVQAFWPVAQAKFM